MTTYQFTANHEPTLGIELELGLVDDQTMALTNAIGPLLQRLPEAAKSRVKPELMQCYVELNTGVCATVEEAERDLRRTLACVEQAADALQVRLLWSATHPFSHWQEQEVTPDERYHRLVDLLQDMARQLVCFGLHVHVAVDSGDKAVMISDRIMRYLPVLLALTCNSPWWEGRASGLQSHRAKIMENLPTAGLPTLMRNWSEYVWLVTHLVETGFINSIREIWWDVRPHHNFGTVELRVCDMPGSLDDALAVAALVQCLVRHLSNEIDRGTYQHDGHPMMVRQNKWRACRFGLDAELIDPFTCEPHPVRETIKWLVEQLMPLAEELGCADYLARADRLARGTSWASRQLDALARLGNPADVVRELTDASRITTPRQS